MPLRIHGSSSGERARGGNETNKNLKDLLPQIIHLYYKSELPTKEIAVRLGISKTSIKRLLKKSGYVLRNPSDAMKLAHKKGRTTLSKYERTPEIRQKIAEGLREYYSQHPSPCLGRHHSEETKVKFSLDRRDKHPSAETRERMRQITTKRFSDPGNHPMYGRHHTQESKLKMSESGRNRKFSAEHKQKIAKATRTHWQNPEYRAKVIPACLKSRRPTNLEKKIIDLISKYNLPYKYTGDGSFIIGRLNPDFVNVNGDKIAIEVFGGHWHKNRKEPLRTEAGRRAILKEYGWELIVIWGDELKSLPEEEVVGRIKNV